MSGDDLVAFVKARIGSVKAPKQIEFWDALPRSTVGKILKTGRAGGAGGELIAVPVTQRCPATPRGS